VLKKLNCSREGPTEKLSTERSTLNQTYEGNDRIQPKGGGEGDRRVNNVVVDNIRLSPLSSRDEGPAYKSLCSAISRSNYRQCISFGEFPHIKTFYDEFQTCRMRNSVLLVDNEYLTVKITNETYVGLMVCSS